MGDLALYRKYRPSKFKDVVGQAHVVDVLSSAIENKKIVHAYLFAGSRGIGKTSIARIFANEIGTKDEDIYEIDAASNRGIDEIRELRDSVHTLPFNSEYKVFIIDEVHMLTTPAFNALLKTLEEPPKHVVFILATTEIHKLPDTIVSRCQTFSFKKPTDDELQDTLGKIAKKEGYSIDKPSLSLLAALGEGSFRDAIGNLQKVLEVSKDNKLTIDEVERVTGAPKSELVKEILSETLNANSDKAIKALNKAVDQDVDVKVLAKLVMRYLRYAMLLVFAREMKDDIEDELSESDFEFLESLGKHPNSRALSAFLKELLEAYQKIDGAYIRQLPLELVIVKVTQELSIKNE